MNRQLLAALIIVLSLGFRAKAQEDEDIESEVSAAQPVQKTPTHYPPPQVMKSAPATPEVEIIRPPAAKKYNSAIEAEEALQKQILERAKREETVPPRQPAPSKYGSAMEAEEALQRQILERKRRSENEVSADRNLNRFPRQEPLFKRPPGPAAGGTVRVEHPRAAEGLLRVNKDGSYQYKTKLTQKSRSSSLRFSSMSPPEIKGENSTVTYESMYGSSNLLALLFNYEWQPFRGFGALGVQIESGLTTATGKGTFRVKSSARPDKAEESYNLYIVPMSLFLIYRFEYFSHQWVVPFVNGGATYFGMAEFRDDGKTPAFAGAPAVGGGGGLLFSLSRLDSAGAFTLSQEYGISDMWLVLEARAMQGLYSDTDFSGQSINAGIAVDF